MAEPNSTAGLLWYLGRIVYVLVLWLPRRLLGPDPKLVLDQRLKWEPLIRNVLVRSYEDKLRTDVIVHDISRYLSYPDQDTWKDRLRGLFSGARIDSWFRAGLVEIGSKCVGLHLGWYTLKRLSPDHGWIQTHKTKIEGEVLKVALIAYVPLEYIYRFTEEGDDWCGGPHFYVEFANKGTPYDRLAFCIKRDRPGTWPYYQEVEDYEFVSKRTKTYEPYLDGAF